MGLEVGTITEGKVTGITKFGAFIDLGDEKTGMVHISEVASSYVTEIREHLKEGQVVKVLVMSISDDGKIALSIKRTEEPKKFSNSRSNNRRPRAAVSTTSSMPPADIDWSRPEPTDFEDMMSRFKQSSDNKMSDLKRSMNLKKGSSRRSGCHK